MDTTTLVPESVDGHVILAFDGSPDSERAVRWAVEIAQDLKCPLTVVTARDLSRQWPAMVGGSQEWDDVASERLGRATAQVGQHGGLAPQVIATKQPPVQALRDLSTTARMVVLGARGHTRVGGTLVGSVSQHLVQHASCSVAVVREPASTQSRDVVVGVDGSEENQAAVKLAFEVAAARGVGVVAVFGWHPDSGERPIGRLPLSGDVVDHVHAGEQLVEAAVEPWQRRYPGVEVLVEAVPIHPSRLLSDASAHRGLVVVGSRGRGAFTGMLLGSVSQSVLAHAHSPVIVAR
ncbi:universal stress protein [Angustibacter sp. McL0619]|uniref:universal stress protein n=1 Tax=Angustibacter sp. McL0619 TaxID=3415676 RepID=UPI003CF5A03C